MNVSYASNGAVKIAYQTFGPPDGEPVLLIMGLTYQMIWWPDGFCRELAAQGFAVARFDNRDSGLSTHFTSPPRGIIRALLGRGGPAYRIEDMASDVLAVMDALGWDYAHLFGESLGATIAQVTAIRHPDRVRGLVCAMAAGPGSPASNLRYLNIGTLLRLARKRYDSTREGGVQRLADTYLTLCAPGHLIDKEWVRRTAEESIDRDHDPVRPSASSPRSGPPAALGLSCAASMCRRWSSTARTTRGSAPVPRTPSPGPSPAPG